MNNVLPVLGSLSLGGGLVIAMLALTARLSRSRYAARWRCWIWLVLCLRLALPISISLPRQTPPIQIDLPQDTVVLTPHSQGQPSQSPVVPQDTPADQPQQPLPEEPERAPASITLFEILGLVWLMGAAATMAWAIFFHLRFLAYLRRWGKPVADSAVIRCFNEQGDLLRLWHRPRLLVCGGLKTPMLAGVFRTTLLLPEKPLEAQELRYALLHELTHFKRHDIWLKSLALLVRCLHWFNPMMWYMAHLIERDTELACDEAALRCLPCGEHSAYGKTILNAVERLKAAP